MSSLNHHKSFNSSLENCLIGLTNILPPINMPCSIYCFPASLHILFGRPLQFALAKKIHYWSDTCLIRYIIQILTVMVIQIWTLKRLHSFSVMQQAFFRPFGDILACQKICLLCIVFHASTFIFLLVYQWPWLRKKPPNIKLKYVMTPWSVNRAWFLFENLSQ